MKKKNFKSLQLNKRSISKLQSNSIKGGDTFLSCVTPNWTINLISWALDCLGGEEPDPVTSNACTDTQNDDSCQCTIA